MNIRSISAIIIAVLLIALLVRGFALHFGWSSRDNEVIAQVKRVHHATPIICLPYDEADLSLGVMRNGVGSLSTQDIWVYVPDKANTDALTKAAESGTLVRITYDAARLRWCVENDTVTKVQPLN